MAEAGAEIFDAARLGLFTVPPGRPFLTNLATTILKQYADHPLKIADLTVYLPTRRAARALTDTFLRQAGPAPKALLLPRIRTLGDVDETDLPDISGVDWALAPAVSVLERRLVLARLVHKRDAALSVATGRAENWTTALHTADELASLVDAFYTEQTSFDRLAEIVPESYAEHWQDTLEFLEIVTEAWPDYLKQRKLLDLSDYRRQLIDALSASWDEEQGGAGPTQPVIIAGSTGSVPAVSRLMRLVAGLPNGCVVLPGLDQVMDEPAWAEIEDPHPQAGIKNLLDKYFGGISRDEVRQWPGSMDAEGQADRQQLISLALRPAEATDDWLEKLRDLQGTTDLQNAVAGLSLVEAADEIAEAQAIAMALRGTLEEEGKTAILVTPDRVLARRVSALLERWNVKLDDSAGVPFANTLRGGFLRLVAAWLADTSDPVALLALLKHPLCAAGFDRQIHSARAQTMDIALRGLRPARGIEGLKRRLKASAEWDALSQDEDSEAPQDTTRWQHVAPLINRLEEIVPPPGNDPCIFKDILAGHIRVAEKLASTDKDGGGLRLWAYEDGEAGANLLANLLRQSDLLPEVTIADYPGLFDGLIAGTAVRFRGQQHPRLMILGPLEARLQHADLVILAGLNEGTWPDEARTDAFLSRPMRKELGLPSPEQRVGLSAHDFSQGACAREVLLTRSKRSGRSPAKPSRWIVRLKNILAATELLDSVDQTALYNSWAEQLDAPAVVEPASPPAPCPPVEARPRKFSVSTIEKLMRDPYSVYASKVLGLRKLDMLDLDPGFAMRGRFYHHVLARFALEHPNELPSDPISVLAGYADDLFAKAGVEPAVQAFWQARMLESFNWFGQFHAGAAARGRPVIIEQEGRWAISAGDANYTVTARADRIDHYQDGLCIYDYKTGRVPTKKQSKTFSPQLHLTGLIAQNGGYGSLPSTVIAGFAFLKVLNRKKGDEVTTGEEAVQEISDAETKLRALLEHYHNPVEPYLSQPRAFYLNEYGDYDHLARRAEWASVSGEDS